MRFHDLGPLQVSVSGDAVDLGPRLQRLLLALLLMEAPHPVTVDALIERLWSERAPTTARKSIHKYVGRLRAAIGADRIERVDDGYAAVVEPDTIDSRRFVALIERAGASDRAELQVELIERALGLWSGSVLYGLGTPHAELERIRLEEMRLTAIEDLFEAQLQTGREGAVVASAERFVADHPFRERAWRALMLAHYRLGRQRDALAAYARLRSVLVEELGVEPGTDLRELEQAMIEQSPALASTSLVATESLSFHEVRSVVIVVPIVAGGPPERYDASVRELSTEVDRAAQRHGGVRPVNLTDGLVVAFGCPATSTDTESAAQLALELAEAVPHARVGVAAGRAIVESTSGGLALVGAVVDHARALAVGSADGEVAVDEAVARRLGPNATFGERVAGRSPLVAFDESDEPLVEMVGRDDELEAVLDVIDRAFSRQSSELVTLVGDAGVGKTRLVREVERIVGVVHPPAVWVGVTCRERGDGDATAIRRLLRRAPVPADAPAWMDAILRLGEVDTTALTNPRFEDVRADVADYLVGSDAPRIIVVEDLHNATAPFGALLDEVLLSGADRPLVVICTTRPTDRTPELLPDGGARSSRLALSALTSESAEALLDSVAELPPDVADRVIERAGGNPLFLVEFARSGSTEAELPDTLEAVVTARLDQLHQIDRTMLELLATAGGPLSAEAAAGAFGEEVAAVRTSLNRLRHLGLVVAGRGIERNHLRVHHDLVAEVAGRLVPRVRSTEWHRRLVEWFEAEEPADLDRLVFHLVEVVAAEPDDVSIRRRLAVAACRLGASVEMIDPQRTFDAYLLGIEHAEPGSEICARAHLGAGRTASVIKRWDVSEDYLLTAIGLLNDAGDATGKAVATVHLATARWYLGKPDAVDDVGQAVLELADRPGPELAFALASRLSMLAMAGQADATAAAAEYAEPIIEEFGTDSDKVRVLGAVGVSMLERGDLGGLERLARALEVSRNTAPWQVVSSYNNLGYHTWFAVGADKAVELIEEGLAAADYRRTSYICDWMRATLAEVLVDVGRWDDVDDIVADLVNHASDVVVDSAAYCAGLAALYRNDFTAARGWLNDERAARSIDIQDLQYVAPWLAVRAMLAVGEGNVDGARELLLEFAKVTEPSPAWRAHMVHEVMRAAVAAGADDLLDLLRIPEPSPVVRAELCRRTAEAEYLAARGHTDAAVAEFETVAAGWAEFGNPYQAAVAEAALARLGAADASRAQAARSTLRDLGVR